MTIRLERFRSAFYRLLSSSRSAEPRVYVIEIDKLAFGPAPERLHVNDRRISVIRSPTIFASSHPRIFGL